MYVFGGRGEKSSVCTDLWCYDIESNSWEEINIEKGKIYWF
jgi:hypothetical protein